MSDTRTDLRLSFTLGQEKNTIAYRKRKKSPNTKYISQKIIIRQELSKIEFCHTVKEGNATITFVGIIKS